MAASRSMMHHSIPLVLASIIGTFIEFYGFSLFVMFGDVIAVHFFPSQDPTVSLLWVYAIFASSFLMRPLGAAIFGYIGDKYGRQWALYISISFMGLTLFTIGLLPTYKSIGMLAPIMIVACRLSQGICAGGEYNNAGIFAIESFATRPALAGSLVAFGAGTGALLAIALKQLSDTTIEGFELWRLPFLIGAVLSFMGYRFRKRLKDLFSIEEAKPFPWKVLLDFKASSITAFSIGAIDGAFAYMMVGFMGTYLHLFIGLPQAECTEICMYAFVAYLFFAPLIGYFADFGDTLFLFRVTILLVIPTSYFVFSFITSGVWILILIAELIFVFMYAAISALQHAYLVTLFPSQLRSRGVGVSFSLGGALFGGGAPLILTSLLGIYADTMIPGYFLSLVGLFCLSTCLLTLSKRSSQIVMAPV